jgi:hypothetical protein
MKNEIVIYQPENIPVRINVRIEDETVWLSQAQMTELFQSTKQNISLHINNIYKEGELQKESTVKDYLTVRTEGNRQVKRKITLYNLDVIISVGYRVKSKQGTQFRIWATGVLKEYLLKGYAINNRMNRIEDNVEQLAKKVNEIDLQLKTNLPPNQGVFFDGQIFDAYAFVNNLLKNANNNVILIDNYIDDTVLTLFSKYPHLNFTIITSKISKQLQLDIDKYIKQYHNLKIEISKKYHDRFLIIDNQTYHIGASLKDLGKKIFAFSKMNIDVVISG